jgi:hypothetical protein
MKTKNIFKALVLASVLVSACGKHEIANNDKGYSLPVTINVTRQGDEPATRASYNESTRKLEFSAGDKLFVEGWDNNTAGSFKGVLTWVSGGTFSGSINTEKEYTGTADALLTDAAYVTATLLPAGYESYAFLSIEDETDCSGWVGRDISKAFAPTKKAAVEQFSYEYTYSYSSGFALAPQTAILSFTISGLAANAEVAVLFKEAYDTEATPVNVTTDASGVATFAVAVESGYYIDDYTLTVDGIDITLPDKTAEKGHIYNISRPVHGVFWNSSDISNIDISGGGDVEIGGIKFACDENVYFSESNLISMSGNISFTSSLGNIKKIEINYSKDSYWSGADGFDGWPSEAEGGKFTWEGTPTETVELPESEGYGDINGITSIVFTLE